MLDYGILVDRIAKSISIGSRAAGVKIGTLTGRGVINRNGSSATIGRCDDLLVSTVFWNRDWMVVDCYVKGRVGTVRRATTDNRMIIRRFVDIVQITRGLFAPGTEVDTGSFLSVLIWGRRVAFASIGRRADANDTNNSQQAGCS